MQQEQLKKGNLLNKEIINIRTFIESVENLKTITMSAGEGDKIIFSATDNDDNIDGLSEVRNNCITEITKIMHEYEKNMIKEFENLWLNLFVVNVVKS